jgi:hypothetical protein
MTPEERAKSVLHFLDAYIDARSAFMDGNRTLAYALETARQFLGTALVALVTDARKVDE